MDEEIRSNGTGGYEPGEYGGPDTGNESDWAGEDGADTVISKRELRLGTLILKMMDGELEERYFLRMQKWLSCDERALGYYIEFVQLCACLHLMISKKKDRLEMFAAHV